MLMKVSTSDKVDLKTYLVRKSLKRRCSKKSCKNGSKRSKEHSTGQSWGNNSLIELIPWVEEEAFLLFCVAPNSCLPQTSLITSFTVFHPFHYSSLSTSVKSYLSIPLYPLTCFILPFSHFSLPHYVIHSIVLYIVCLT